MNGANIPLDNIDVAAPCTAEWRFMHGNDRVRFCGQCNLNVYNLSAMTREEAEDLIRKTEGRLCVRFYRRIDGTVLTQNCPVGLRAAKERVLRVYTALAAALFAFLFNIGLLSWLGKKRPEPVRMGVLVADNNHAYVPAVRPAVMGEFMPAENRGNMQPTQRSEGFMRDRAVFKVTPMFPSDGRAKANAVVRVTISEDGEVEAAQYVSGPAQLSELAEEAASRWKFEPVVERGKPRSVQSTLTFHVGR
jgi:TonB family protein